MSQEIAVQTETSAMITMIERVAMSPDIDVVKLEKMLDMQERVLNRNAEIAFNAAMSQAQSAMGRISADAVNPQTRSRYATYAKLDSVLRPIYTAEGFSLSFGTGENAPEGHVRVICYVAHNQGHSRHYQVDMPADGMGIKGNAMMTKTHATGSAMSYGMRYLLKLIFNVAIGENDDDGNAAGTVAAKISEEQANTIHAMITDNGLDMPKFIGWLKGSLKCASIEDINEAAYPSVIAALNKKIKGA